MLSLVAFTEQKENDINNNLRKIPVGLYNDSALITVTFC